MLPALSYALTTISGPVAPGQVIVFTATVTNLSTVTQNVTLDYAVPQFTTGGDTNTLGFFNFPAGTAVSYDMGAVAAGATAVVSVDFEVLCGSQAPSDGLVVTLVVSDTARSASVSRSATVRSVPAVVLALSTPQSQVTSGGIFSYTLAYHNGTSSTLSNAQLSLPLPAGASFVSADGARNPSWGDVVLGGTEGVSQQLLTKLP